MISLTVNGKQQRVDVAPDAIALGAQGDDRADRH